MGPTSGLSFLNRAWQRLHQDSASPKAFSSAIMTGEKSLTLTTSVPFALPAWTDAVGLVSRYFDFVVPTHRFLHRGTVHEWLSEMYKAGTEHASSDGPTSDREAMVFMIFASSLLYKDRADGSIADAEEESYQRRYGFYCLCKSF